MRHFGTIWPYFVILDTEARPLTELELVPVRLRRFQLQRPPDEDRSSIRDRMSRECARFGHRLGALEDRLVLER